MGRDNRARGRARERVIARLLAGTAAKSGAAKEEGRARRRRLRRVAWAMGRIDDPKHAQQAADAAWMALVAPYADLDEDELPELDDPPEQAAVDAIHAEIRAATEEDRWPAHLHWSL